MWTTTGIVLARQVLWQVEKNWITIGLIDGFKAEEQVESSIKGAE
jgi:hypothetical protein